MMIEVRDSSQAGEARRKAAEFAHDLQFGEVRSGAAALAATEMATNLVKHAGNGTLLLQRVRENGNSGLRLIAIDNGPGIADVARALQDGHSTAGSMGSGLGAVQRVSDIFEVYSATGVGTLIRSEFWEGNHHHPPINGTFEYGCDFRAHSWRRGMWRRLGTPQFRGFGGSDGSRWSWARRACVRSGERSRASFGSGRELIRHLIFSGIFTMR